MSCTSLDSWTVMVALFLIVQKDPVCFSYTIPNQFGAFSYAQFPGGFQEVSRFQGFGPGSSQQWISPQRAEVTTYYSGNGPSFTSFSSSSSSSHSSSGPVPGRDEPLSFSHPILSQGRNVPVFESVVITNQVDPVFTYANYDAIAKHKPAPPPAKRYFTPFVQPQNAQFSNYPVQSGLVNQFQPQAPFWSQSQPRQGFSPQNPSVMMAMTPSSTGGGVLFPNPKYNQNLPFGGESPSTSDSRPLPSFRTIRKAPPGSFFISVRGRDGIITYAPEPVFKTPRERSWNAKPRVTPLKELPPLPTPAPRQMSTTSTPSTPTPIAQPPRYYHSGGSYSYPKSGGEKPAMPMTPGRGQHSGQAGVYSPFHDPTHYYPYQYTHPHLYPPSYSNSSMMGNDVVYLGQQSQQNPWGSKSNDPIMPTPSSSVVRQSKKSSNYSPLHIAPSLLMDTLIRNSEPSQNQILCQTARRSRRQNYPRQDTQQAQPQSGFPSGWNQPQSHPQLQPLFSQGQTLPYPQRQGQPPPNFQIPQKSNGFGSNAYPFNGQNRQFQPGAGGQQQQFLPHQGGQSQQSFFHQNSWRGSELGAGVGIRPSPQPPPFFAWRGGGGNTNSNNGNYPSITGTSRSGEQRAGSGLDPRAGGDWIGNKFPTIPERPHFRPYEAGQQQQQQHKGWKTNVTNPYEQKESTDNPKEAKTSVLPNSGGEMSIHSKFGDNANVTSHRINGGVSGVNETKENYKFTSDSTILQRHLQQAKQVLREQKAREEQSGTGSEIRKRSRHHNSSHQHESVTEQSATTKGHRSELNRIQSSSPSVSTHGSKSNFTLQSTSSSAGTSGDFDRGNGSISTSKGISTPSSSTTTDADTGVKLSEQLQWIHQRQFVPPPQSSSSTHDVLATNFPKHGRFSRHLKGMTGFASAEDLLAMELQPLDLGGDGILDILKQ